jgi:hypothetical protein
MMLEILALQDREYKEDKGNNTHKIRMHMQSKKGV